MTIEPEEGAEEGAEKKVRTKTITLLGARKGPGGKAAYPNGDAFEGSYFAGKRHGAAGSYTHTACRKQAGSALGRLALRRLVAAPEHIIPQTTTSHVHVSPCLRRYAAQPPPAEGEDPLPPDGKYEGSWKKGETLTLTLNPNPPTPNPNPNGKYEGSWKKGEGEG